MNKLPTEEPVNGKKKNIRQILSVEELDTQHIRICIHRILISIYFIAVSQLHQMQSIHRTMFFFKQRSVRISGNGTMCSLDRLLNVFSSLQKGPMKIGPRQRELFAVDFGVIAEQ